MLKAGVIMRIVVISDSHGRGSVVDGIIRREKDAEVIIFLGDVTTDIEDFTYDHFSSITTTFYTKNLPELEFVWIKKIIPTLNMKGREGKPGAMVKHFFFIIYLFYKICLLLILIDSFS